MHIFFSSSRRFSSGSHIEHRKVDGFDLLLAKYSSKENSQVVASKERCPGDLLPETFISFRLGLRFWIVFSKIRMQEKKICVMLYYVGLLAG